MGRLTAEAAPEGRKGQEGASLLPAQSRPGVVERRPEAAMPAGNVASLGLEEVEVLGDLGSDLAHRQDVDPRRRQQNPERQPIGQAKDLRQGVEVTGLENEFR